MLSFLYRSLLSQFTSDVSSRWKRGRQFVLQQSFSEGKSTFRDSAITPDFFDENEAAVAKLRCDSSCARTREWVEDDVARRRVGFDEWPNGDDGLFIGVMLVAGIFPRQ